MHGFGAVSSALLAFEKAEGLQRLRGQVVLFMGPGGPRQSNEYMTVVTAIFGGAILFRPMGPYPSLTAISFMIALRPGSMQSMSVRNGQEQQKKTHQGATSEPPRPTP